MAGLQRGGSGQRTSLAQSVFLRSYLSQLYSTQMWAARHLLPRHEPGYPPKTQNGQAQGSGNVTEDGVRRGGYVCLGKMVGRREKGGGSKITKSTSLKESYTEIQYEGIRNYF